jgi:hypothetical protein
MVQIFECMSLNESCAKNSSYSRHYHKFHQKFPAANAPSISMKKRQVKKIHSIGQYMIQQNTGKSILTLNKLDETGPF